MDSEEASPDLTIAKLVEMGFEYYSAKEAVENIGLSINDAANYILNKACGNSRDTSSSSKFCPVNKKPLGKRALPFSDHSGKMRQSSIFDHFQSNSHSKKSKIMMINDVPISGTNCSSYSVEACPRTYDSMHQDTETTSNVDSVHCPKEIQIGPNWEQTVNDLLQKRFGYSSLKSFQKEALATWIDQKDCLVLAATGSGKSMCFQIPALLTGKVVVVVSPLISLMHDQCLKLAKHGVSACFLGSGQPDHTIEHKAMSGMYDLIYVCPETIIRLVDPLQKLAKGRGIALFAIDEGHCVSKWGHDFRPDYRRLSVLRNNFNTSNLNFLQCDIPLMVLTATATKCVRQDIMKCLCMSTETKIVLTSFFRPNLRFSVKHSRTSSPASYRVDFLELINTYLSQKTIGQSQKPIFSDDLYGKSESCCDYSDSSKSDVDEDISEVSPSHGSSASLKERCLTVEFLEDEIDVFQGVDDWDVSCGEFRGLSNNQPVEDEEGSKIQQESLVYGPTIIYVPTRKETVSISRFLCESGIRAAAYNAKLPKSHLRRVHEQFHENNLEVVVATIAFGMGIDKSNVRRIIHYGWPQSLEAYYQEAGRAGRDGKLAECILYANLLKAPSLLPNKRSEDQLKQASKMLAECYRYGMNTSSCRAKTLVEYFGEDFSGSNCRLCDVCVKGPPQSVNVKEEANIFLQAIFAYHRRQQYLDEPYDDYGASSGIKQTRHMDRPNLRMFISKIREQDNKYMATDTIWWRGLARILETEGYIMEGHDKVSIKFLPRC
ncbi:hypothetical protein SAY87_015410 [Trapa incisa]|uniref:ATP-dependent DNA helicase n=1 Tax=Trapa incisa TaxID=236973 RepID=A0AAN7JKY3_9MYRT|nr:hypothetical protein SAY87_015410 [Trapa incisa]